MNSHDTVSDIMTRNVLTVQKDSDLQDAIALIQKHRIRHLPVLEGTKVVGIVTSNDIDRLTFGALFEDQDLADEAVLSMLSIPQIMSANPHTVNSKDSVRSVAEIFVDKKYHALVVQDQGHVAGIVTTTDLIQYLLDQLLVK